MALPVQIKMIHTLGKALRLDRDAYEAVLSSYGVTSSTALSPESARGLIDTLKMQALAAGVWRERPSSLKYAELGGRDREYATPAQLRLLAALWADVSWAKSAAGREKAFNTFLSKRFGIACVEWLPRFMVGKMVRSLQAMKQQRDSKSRGVETGVG